MVAYRQALEEGKGVQRFKIDKYIEDIPALIEECYKFQVDYRRGIYLAGEVKTMIEQAARWLVEDRKVGLMLYGEVGSGKSTLAAAIRQMLIVTFGQRIEKVTALELSMAAKDDREAFSNYLNCKMLLIDDMGEEPTMVKSYGNEISPFVETIYSRYDKQRFTIITTNLLDDEIKEIYGVRVADRFNEMFDRIYFDNKSYRK